MAGMNHYSNMQVGFSYKFICNFIMPFSSVNVGVHEGTKKNQSYTFKSSEKVKIEVKYILFLFF